MFAGIAVLPTATVARASREARRTLETPKRPEVVQEPAAKGKFLVAGTELLDPNFAETVVLLVDYNSEGALGVIINRPTDTLASEVLPDLGTLSERPDRIWLGGPVAQWQLVMLARSEGDLAEGRLVMGDLYFSSSRSDLESVVSDQGTFRLYAGYAGWSAGQLDQEIERGGWRVLPAEISMVFDKAPLDLWRELIQRSTVHWAQRRIPAGDRSADTPAR